MSFALLVVAGCGAEADDGAGTDGTNAGGGVAAPSGVGPAGSGTDPGAATNPDEGTASGTDTGTATDPAAGTDTETGIEPSAGTDPGAGTESATDGAAGAAGDGSAEVDPSTLEPFSFFVTSLEIMRELSGSRDGFGGDFGGLEGADSICQQAAAAVGFGAKTWRAFLSATDDGNGNPVHAIERIGEGPWYDRNGRLVAENVDGLLNTRPEGDAQTVGDLPNEYGEGLTQFGDTHDILTATNSAGELDSTDPANTCNDWTSTTVEVAGGFDFGGFGGGGGGGGGGIRVGHSWPAMSGQSWVAAHSAHSCAPGVNLVQSGPGDGSSVGAGGGWGAIYCFALQP
ncbi:MAG: hypothetical protein PVI30_02505 [Myxococcales bacterium]